MYDKRTVDVPVRWILGAPDLADTIEDCTEATLVGLGNFDMDYVESLAEDARMAIEDVVAKVYTYHNWFEVLVLESRATGRDVVAYTMLSSDEISAGSLHDLEPQIAKLWASQCSVEIEW